MGREGVCVCVGVARGVLLGWMCVCVRGRRVDCEDGRV